MFLPLRFHEWSVSSFFNTYEGIEGRFKKKLFCSVSIFLLFILLSLSYLLLSCSMFLPFFCLSRYLFLSLFQSSFPNFNTHVFVYLTFPSLFLHSHSLPLPFLLSFPSFSYLSFSIRFFVKDYIYFVLNKILFDAFLVLGFGFHS